jgi:transcriptional regulator with XRE-family HTH domain
MLLTRLKYWRELRGYSLRELADKSKVPYSAISLLENLKREPQGRTARKLAAALGIEVVDLHQPDPVVLEPKYTPAQPVNDNRIITPAKPVRTRAAKKQPANYCWVVDFEGDAFGPFEQAEADKLKGKLGGQHQARVYQAATRAEAREQHRAFLIRVARGHDVW